MNIICRNAVEYGICAAANRFVPTMTVKQNIEVIPEMLGWEKQKRADRVDELLQKVGLSPDIYRDRMPRELSGGEQQRIRIIELLLQAQM